jgi:hypothetical protein
MVRTLLETPPETPAALDVSHTSIQASYREARSLLAQLLR